MRIKNAIKAFYQVLKYGKVTESRLLHIQHQNHAIIKTFNSDIVKITSVFKLNNNKDLDLDWIKSQLVQGLHDELIKIITVKKDDIPEQNACLYKGEIYVSVKEEQ